MVNARIKATYALPQLPEKLQKILFQAGLFKKRIRGNNEYVVWK